MEYAAFIRSETPDTPAVDMKLDDDQIWGKKENSRNQGRAVAAVVYDGSRHYRPWS